MRAAWFIGKFDLHLNCTKYPNYSPKSRTPQQPQTLLLIANKRVSDPAPANLLKNIRAGKIEFKTIL